MKSRIRNGGFLRFLWPDFTIRNTCVSRMLKKNKKGTSGMAKRVAIYLRVSTTNQTTDNQRRELEAVAQASGWQIVEFYEDFGISGAKSKDKRPAFKRMLEDATRRKFDMVAAWSIDRLGRSLQDLVGFLNDINALNVDLYLHQQAIDTSTASGKLIFHVCSVFAEFERSIISERVKAGLERAKSLGKTLGRPRIRNAEYKKIVELLLDGYGIIKVAKMLKVGTSTVHNIKKDLLIYGNRYE